MSRLLKSTVAVLVMAFVAGGFLATSAVARVLSEPITLDGLNSSARVAATPDAFWFGQVNRDGLCRLLTGCESATGSGSDWVYRMRMPVPAVGMQLVDVNVHVSEQVLLEKVRLSLSYDNALGSLNGDVTMGLRASGAGTIVTVKVEDMAGTGIAATAIPQLQSRLVPDLQNGLADLGRESAMAGAKVRLTIAKGRAATATAKVSGASLSTKAPVAKGLMRVVIGRKVVCTAPVKSNTARCKFRPPARGTKVKATVTGSFDNGYPIWISAQKRYGK